MASNSAIRERQSGYYHRDPGKFKRRVVEYRSRNPEKVKRWAATSRQRRRGMTRLKAKKYREDNRDEIRSYARNWYRKLRDSMIAHYGGKCACCGEENPRFLSIDHVNGGGKAHLKKITGGPGGSVFYVWLKRNNFPEGFQVLCFNCRELYTILP